MNTGIIPNKKTYIFKFYRLAMTEGVQAVSKSDAWDQVGEIFDRNFFDTDDYVRYVEVAECSECGKKNNLTYIPYLVDFLCPKCKEESEETNE